MMMAASNFLVFFYSLPSTGNEVLVGTVRNLFGPVGMFLCLAVGYLILPLFAFFLRAWRSLLMTISLPCLIYVPLFW